jgi:CheY-like chemotaxis protein
MRLLQIEDNRADVTLVREALKEIEAPVEIRVIEDGQAALDFLVQCEPETSLPCPDIILLDLNLPCKHGDEVLTELKQHPRFKGIPVVVFTGTDEPREVYHCYQLCRLVWNSGTPARCPGSQPMHESAAEEVFRLTVLVKSAALLWYRLSARSALLTFRVASPAPAPPAWGLG